jgi:hypothetical protein
MLILTLLAGCAIGFAFGSVLALKLLLKHLTVLEADLDSVNATLRLDMALLSARCDDLEALMLKRIRPSV